MGVKVMDAGGWPLSCSHIEFRFTSQPFLLSSLEPLPAVLVYLWSGRLFANPALFLCLKSPAPFPHSAKEWWYVPSIKHYVLCKMLIIKAHHLHIILTTTLLCWPHFVILSRLFSWLLLQKVLIRIIWDVPEECLVQCWGWGALHTSYHCPFHWPPRQMGYWDSMSMARLWVCVTKAAGSPKLYQDLPQAWLWAPSVDLTCTGCLL